MACMCNQQLEADVVLCEKCGDALVGMGRVVIPEEDCRGVGLVLLQALELNGRYQAVLDDDGDDDSDDDDDEDKDDDKDEQELQQRCAAVGQRQHLQLEPLQTAGDGNCMFHALIGALANPGAPSWDQEWTHSSLRAATVAWLKGTANSMALMVPSIWLTQSMRNTNHGPASSRQSRSLASGAMNWYYGQQQLCSMRPSTTLLCQLQLHSTSIRSSSHTWASRLVLSGWGRGKTTTGSHSRL